MSPTEKTLEVSSPSTEIESRVLPITVPRDYEQTVSPQNSPSALSQITKPITELSNSWQGCYTSLSDKMHFQEASGSASSTA